MVKLRPPSARTSLRAEATAFVSPSMQKYAPRRVCAPARASLTETSGWSEPTAKPAALSGACARARALEELRGAACVRAVLRDEGGDVKACAVERERERSA